MTPEDIELRDKYFKRVRELWDTDAKYDEETFRWLGEDIRRIWD